MISVCIPTYNGGKYIREQLDSILPQLSPEDEVIVSDDRSDDQTLDIIRGLNDKRIRIVLHRQVENPYKGPYRNIYYVYRNVEHALSHASGDYIFLSDQDDIWKPNKVREVMAAFAKGSACVMHDSTVIDHEGNTLLPSYFQFIRPSYHRGKMLVKAYFQGASMAFTRNVLKQSLPFPRIPVSHDHWIAYNAVFRDPDSFLLLPESLMLYRRHGGNVSPTSGKSPNPLWFKLSYRVYLFMAFLKVKCRKP